MEYHARQSGTRQRGISNVAICGNLIYYIIYNYYIF